MKVPGVIPNISSELTPKTSLADLDTMTGVLSTLLS